MSMLSVKYSFIIVSKEHALLEFSCFAAFLVSSLVVGSSSSQYVLSLVGLLKSCKNR